MITGVLMPFIVGFAFAYLLNGPTNYFEQKVFYRFKCRRGLAVLLVYLLVIALLAVLVKLILPQIVQSIVALYSIIQSFFLNINTWMQEAAIQLNIDQNALNEFLLDLNSSYKDIMTNLSNMLSKAVPYVLSMGVAVGSGVVSGVISAITTVISSVYMLLDKDRLSLQSKKLVYAVLPTGKANRLITVCAQANGIFSGFINGKILDSAIIGVLCFFLSLAPADRIFGAHQRGNRGDQRDSLLRPHRGRGPLRPDPAAGGPLAGPALRHPGPGLAAVRREHPRPQDSGRQHRDLGLLGVIFFPLWWAGACSGSPGCCWACPPSR